MSKQILLVFFMFSVDLTILLLSGNGRETIFLFQVVLFSEQFIILALIL